MKFYNQFIQIKMYQTVNIMKHLILTSIFVASLIPFAQAQDVTVENIQFGIDVQDREVVGADTVFPGDVENIYCLTHITGMDGESSVTHVWYYENEEMARVELPVRSPNWRTWSSKSILPAWTGQWRVDILDPNGEVLVSESFTIE
jgi:hypothetical protein